MIFPKILFILGGSLSVQALDINSGLLRGSVESEQFTCTISGAAGADACKAASDDDGSNCVWCSIASYGFCVSEDQAETMKKSIPNIECSDDGDDDDAVTDDDVAADDDDAAADDDDDIDDDAVPDDYWTCLEDGSDEEGCSSAGCVWCDTKGGFGICMNKDAAAAAADSDWFECKVSYHIADFSLDDPYDTSCLVASLQGDEATCEATVDEDGQPCEWCTLSSANLCLTSEQAEMAGQIGADCSSSSSSSSSSINDGKLEETSESLNDPQDTTCIIVTLQGDEKACEETVDADNSPCKWCTVSSMNFCLNSDQAEIAGSFGADCENNDVEDDVVDTVTVEDPYDTSCLVASMQGDEATCEATVDQDGQPCEWCALSSVNLCLTSDQSEIAQQLGADCDSAEVIEDSTLNDPYDPSCLAVTMQGDESACEASVDAEGQACEWCTLSSHNVCLTSEQAELAEQIGADCSATETMHDNDKKEENNIDFPSDFWTCLANIDSDSCSSSSCKWCKTECGKAVCLDSEAAEALDDCPFFDCDGDEGEDVVVSSSTTAMAPLDPVCLAAGMGSDDAHDVCSSTLDSNGQSCVWCDAAGVFGLCMSADDAKTAGKWLQCDSTIAVA